MVLKEYEKPTVKIADCILEDIIAKSGLTNAGVGGEIGGEGELFGD